MTVLMQVSRRQAALALEVVRRRHRRAPVRVRRRRPRRPASLPSPVFVDLVVRIAEDQPPLRIELVQAATARRAAGEWPSAYEVADMALRRAACDRVR